MYKQSPKSVAMKALVGNQPNLPQALRKAIETSPAKNMNKGYGSPAKQVKGAGGIRTGDSGSVQYSRRDGKSITEGTYITKPNENVQIRKMAGQTYIDHISSSGENSTQEAKNRKSPGYARNNYTASDFSTMPASKIKKILNARYTEEDLNQGQTGSQTNFSDLSDKDLMSLAATRPTSRNNTSLATKYMKEHGLMSSLESRQSSSPAKMKSPAKQVTNDQKVKSMEASKEKKVSVASGASKGKASTNRDYVKGGREKKNGSREKSKTTEFNTFDAGKTYTKTVTKGTPGKGRAKVKTKEISGAKAKRQADRLNKRYTQV